MKKKTKPKLHINSKAIQRMLLISFPEFSRYIYAIVLPFVQINTIFDLFPIAVILDKPTEMPLLFFVQL